MAGFAYPKHYQFSFLVGKAVGFDLGVLRTGCKGFQIMYDAVVSGMIFPNTVSQKFFRGRNVFIIGLVLFQEIIPYSYLPTLKKFGAVCSGNCIDYIVNRNIFITADWIEIFDMTITVLVMRMQPSMLNTIKLNRNKAIFFAHSEVEGRSSFEPFPIYQQFGEAMEYNNVGCKYLDPVSIESMIADVNKA